MFQKSIVVKDEEPDKLARIFQVEEKSLRTKRFSYKMVKAADHVRFDLKAEDKITSSWHTINKSLNNKGSK